VENEVLQRVKKEYRTQNKKRRKANWVGHNSCKNCILRHVTEVNIEGQGKGGRRCRQLHDDLK